MGDERQILWMIEADPSEPLAPALEPLLPAGTALAPVELFTPWRGPAGHRPVAVIVGIPAGATEEALALVRRVGDRSHLPIVALFERPSADLKHAVLRAGAVATLTVGTTDLSRQRLQRHVESTLRLVLEAPTSSDAPERSSIGLVAIGSSTGGPETIASILAGHGPFDAPIVIAQHVHPGYDASLAAFLTDRGVACRVAAPGEPVVGGVVHLAPAGHDLVVRRGRLQLQPSHGQYVPCVDALFESVALGYGDRALGILLTGMGDDGARGLLALHQAGAFTITQRSDTCIVDGMPASARALDAQSADWSPSEIRSYLESLRDPAATP